MPDQEIIEVHFEEKILELHSLINTFFHEYDGTVKGNNDALSCLVKSCIGLAETHFHTFRLSEDIRNFPMIMI